MQQKKLDMNFKDHKDDDLNKIGMFVVDNIVKSEHFPQAGELIAQLKEAHDVYHHALIKAARRDSHKIALKNEARNVLIQCLRQLAIHVMAVAAGSETILFSSGFPIVTPVNEIILRLPANFRIFPGTNPGEIKMQVSRVEGAKSYLYRWTLAPVTPESTWETLADTRCRKVITNLPLGQNYCFQMAAIGGKSQIVYTQVLSRYIS